MQKARLFVDIYLHICKKQAFLLTFICTYAKSKPFYWHLLSLSFVPQTTALTTCTSTPATTTALPVSVRMPRVINAFRPPAVRSRRNTTRRQKLLGCNVFHRVMMCFSVAPRDRNFTNGNLYMWWCTFCWYLGTETSPGRVITYLSVVLGLNKRFIRDKINIQRIVMCSSTSYSL